MSIRKYREFGVENAAAEIAQEVIRRGTSKGWGGSLENLAAVETILEPFNINYHCDFTGTWGRKGG